MLNFLLSIGLSKVATFAVPLSLCGLAAYLALRNFTHAALAAALIAAGWFVTGVIFQEGVASCEARVATAVSVERDRQAKANAEANDFQRGLVAGLLRGQQELAATIKENENEADSDPDAGQCGLSLGGVLRYEKLRSRAH